MSTFNTSVTGTVTPPPPPTITDIEASLVSGTVPVGNGDLCIVKLNGGSIQTLPSNASITYTSSDTTIATVNANGNTSNPLQSSVTTIKAGTYTVNIQVVQN